MPNVPKWIADQMENLLPSKYLKVEVSAITKYSPEIKKVTFSADLQYVDFYPGTAMIFRVSDTALRHYTPSAFDKKAGTFEIIFHIHRNGPGSNLADNLLPGDRLKVSMPAGKKLYDRGKRSHFFFGDETSLSFYAILQEEISGNNQSSHGIFELDAINQNIPKELGYDMKIVPKTPEDPGKEAINLLEGFLNEHAGLLKQSIFYLTGNVASVQRFRTALKQHGISSGNIKLQGYWSEGIAGL